MKSWLFLMLGSCLLFPRALSAQEIEMGMRAPEIRPKVWIGGVQPASVFSATCILFLSAYNRASYRALERMQELSAYSDYRMRIVVVARENEEQLHELSTYALAHRMAVAVDADGKIFRNFGVEYAPYLLMTDAHNRVVWQGNPTRLTTDVVDAETTRIAK